MLNAHHAQAASFPTFVWYKDEVVKHGEGTSRGDLKPVPVRGKGLSVPLWLVWMTGN